MEYAIGGGRRDGEGAEGEGGIEERWEDQRPERISSNEKGRMCREGEQEEQDGNIESTEGGCPLILLTEVAITRTGAGEVASEDGERVVERLHGMAVTSTSAAPEGG